MRVLELPDESPNIRSNERILYGTLLVAIEISINDVMELYGGIVREFSCFNRPVPMHF